MFKQSRLVLGAALFVAVAACDKSTGLPSEITQADANQLAADMVAVGTLGQSDVGFSISPSFSIGVNGSGAAASVTVPVAINNTFSATKGCPQGGQVAVAGTIVGTGDDATQSLTLDVDATRTDTNCAFPTRHGVLTLSGNPNIEYTGHLNIVNAALVGLQTASHTGSFTWARGGFSGTCNVDLDSSYDPATRIASVTGSFCDWTVNVTRTIPS
jgi:hypothetical protein